MAGAAGARPNNATIKQSDEKMATAGGEVKRAVRARGGGSGATLDLMFGTNFSCPRWNRTCEERIGIVGLSSNHTLTAIEAKAAGHHGLQK